MPSVEYDLWYVRDGIEELESYLLSDAVYWPVGVTPPAGEPPYPQLTLGWLLLAYKRAGLGAKTTDQRAELERLSTPLENIHTQWRSAWERKAAQEFHARLKLWLNYLEEYRKAPPENYDRYTYEVSRRVLLQILKPETSQSPPSDTDLLFGLDKVLKVLLTPGDFIWDQDLIDGFSRQDYWFLYGRLPKEPNTKPR